MLLTQLSDRHVLLCNPTDCSLPGSSVHGILHVSILEWVAMSCLPDSGIEFMSLASPALQADSLPLSHLGSSNYTEGAPDVL